MNAQIEHLPLTALTAWKRNARKHPKKQILQIAASFEAFGFNTPASPADRIPSSTALRLLPSGVSLAVPKILWFAGNWDWLESVRHPRQGCGAA